MSKGMSDKIPFLSNFFDRLFSVSVLEHVSLDQREDAFDEFFRSFCPGGLAVVTLDHVFQLNGHLLKQLETSRDLARCGSNIYGNYSFQELLEQYADIAQPLEPVDPAWTPGSEAFDEERVLRDSDILRKRADDHIADTDVYTLRQSGSSFETQCRRASEGGWCSDIG